MTATVAMRKKSKQSGIVLAREAFKDAVNAVSGIIQTKTPRPVLLNVLLADGKLTATDLEIQASVKIDYHGAPLLLPYSKLKAILNSTRGDSVSLSRSDSSCVVAVGDSKWTLPTEDHSEFPSWEPSGTKLVCKLPASQFASCIQRVQYATDSCGSRYALGAVCIEVDRKEGNVWFVGTDGRRLSSMRVSLGEHQDPDSSQTLVPFRAAKMMADRAKESDGGVELFANSRECVAVIDDGIVITARLVDGLYPKWRDVFPNREVQPTSVNAKELEAATRQAAIVTSEQSKGVAFRITPEGIHLDAKSSESGQASVKCPIFEFGRESDVTLDPKFVIDFLDGVDACEPVSIEAAGVGDPVVFATGDDKECSCVIMPLAKD